MSKIRESARGEDCQVRIPGVCNFDPETTILAHIGGGGMGTKQPDSEASFCCSACHDVLDLRVKHMPFTQFTENELKLYHHEGCMRTRKILIEKGLIILK